MTNAFSKRVDNLRAALNLHFTHYNFVAVPRHDRLHAGHGGRGVSSADDGSGTRGARRMTEEQRRLQKAIKDLHGSESTYLRSEPVHEVFRGETVWEGVVEIFALTDHPTASLAYAWAHETDEGGTALRCRAGASASERAPGTPCGRQSSHRGNQHEVARGRRLQVILGA